MATLGFQLTLHDLGKHLVVDDVCRVYLGRPVEDRFVLLVNVVVGSDAGVCA